MTRRRRPLWRWMGRGDGSWPWSGRRALQLSCFRSSARKAAVSRDEGGLVSLAAAGMRSKEGGVGFDEDAVRRSALCDLLEDGALGVGEVAGEGEIEASREGALRLVCVAGEAVHDAGEAGGGPVLGDEGEEVFPGVTVSERAFTLALASSEVRQWMVMGLRARRRSPSGRRRRPAGRRDRGCRGGSSRGRSHRWRCSGILREQVEAGEGFGRGLVGLLGVDAGGGEDLRPVRV